MLTTKLELQNEPFTVSFSLFLSLLPTFGVDNIKLMTLYELPMTGFEPCTLHCELSNDPCPNRLKSADMSMVAYLEAFAHDEGLGFDSDCFKLRAELK